MPELATILAGFQDAFTLVNLAYVIFGVVIGQFVGAVPGVGPVMAMAIAIPFTFALDPLVAISFLVGINKGGLFGGAIPSILINTPGTPDAAATALDGHPLARSGKPVKATKMALYASVTGDTFSDIVLITLSAPIAILALRMGPVEVCALMIFAFSILAGLLGSSLTKGLIAAVLGLLCATVGLDPEHGTPRFYFGWFELYDGPSLVSVAIGMLAVAEIFRRMAGAAQSAMEPAIPLNSSQQDDTLRWSEYIACRFVMLRGAVIGTVLGAVPGLGSTAAAYMSYAATQRKEHGGVPFGQGNLKGIAATESANSAVVGANLIPLLGIGIPGSVSAALLISAFKIHGIQPGPLLFENQARLIYGLFGAMLMANFLNLIVGHASLRLWTFAVRAPEAVVFPTALLFCIVGVYLSTGGMFGVWLMLLAAVVSLVMGVCGFPVIVFIIAFFLGEGFERSLSQTLVILNGQPLILLKHPIALITLLMACVTVFFLTRQHRKTNA